ncbi:ABC transporter ATP-binding protein [Fusibacter sp. 3D3]|uniref:ABC transporter ATP-binding protein n=1 Tax=Fusibacter sp. 3D3 TaxID=1048380 RepID=UPI000853B667|nr:energy-coupling factor ABC transporter ATP-binding protein [Fusibacter sp. 3D3]GAU75841.1 duplicated ATPase component BL0693 of energizing module of predicted ECF transporter [Fusibacter sp. 3D3]
MIVFDNVSFKYEGSETHSISKVNFKINQGELVVITGRSGCGKSTITRCINGLVPKYFEGEFQGKVMIENVDMDTLPIHLISEKVGSVFQDPRSQFFTVDTLSELAFTCENFGVQRAEISKRIETATRCMGIEHLIGKSIFKLSSGEKQKLAIASVHTLQSKILVLDEPSSNLDYQSIERLKDVLKRLKAQGYTIIISEHRLYYLKELLDKVLYFDEGVLKEQFTQVEFLKLSNDALMNRGLRSMMLFRNPIRGKPVLEDAKEVMKLDRVAFSYKKYNRILENISFKCCEGEVVGLIGNNGVGKTTLGRLLSGVYREKAGSVFFKERATSYRKRREHVSFVMQDADYQLFTESVEKELSIGNEKVSDIEVKVENALTALDLLKFKENHPAALSGGQKQRVTIGLSLVKASCVVIMDEPTSGLDRFNMERVCKSVTDLAMAGKAVILITHDYEFITNVCNRIIYLKNGGIFKDFALNPETEKKLMDCFNDMNTN